MLIIGSACFLLVDIGVLYSLGLEEADRAVLKKGIKRLK